MRAQDILTGPSYDVREHIIRLRAAIDAHPYKGDGTHDHTVAILKRVRKRLNRAPAEHILELCYGVVVQLFEKEGIYEPRFFLTESVSLRDTFIRYEQVLSKPHIAACESALIDLFTEYFTNAPEGAYTEEGTTSVPLWQHVNVRHWVDWLFSSGVQFKGDYPLFHDTRMQLLRNLFEASGKSFDLQTPNDKLTFPRESKLDGVDLIRAYLHDTPFHPLLEVEIPFVIPTNARFSGQWVIAPPNRGKTNLLLHQVLQDLEKPGSVILMDSKGDLINPMRHLSSIKDRLVVLEPNLERPLAINPLDLGASITHTVSLLEYVFGSLLDAEPTALQGTLFRYVLIALTATPNATFADFRRMLGPEGYKPYEEHIRTLEPEDQEFFFNEFDTRTYNETRAQLLWRIRDLTTRIPLLRTMFRAPKTRIDMGALMDAGKVVILDVRKELLADQGTEFLGRLYIALVRAAADQRASRPDSQKLPCYFYIDEAHTIIRNDEKLASILQECRSQKIAMTLAHQAISQIQSAVTLGALSDCAIRMANSDEETSQLAPRLRTTPEVLRSLPIGTFATFVRDATRQAVTLKIPLVNVGQLAKMDPYAEALLSLRMDENYAFQRIAPAAPPAEPPPPQQEDTKPEQESTAPVEAAKRWPLT